MNTIPPSDCPLCCLPAQRDTQRAIRRLNDYDKRVASLNPAEGGSWYQQQATTQHLLETARLWNRNIKKQSKLEGIGRQERSV